MKMFYYSLNSTKMTIRNNDGPFSGHYRKKGFKIEQ